jgi:NitT/TauT family transport system ATP-binding protein
MATIAALANSRSLATSTPLPAVSVQNVSMVYSVKRAPVAALDDVSLELQAGEFVSLIGPSGCGKSTLLRLIADILTPTAGHIEVAGLSPKEARRRHAYSFVFQNPTLFPWLTLQQNVEFALSIVGSSATVRHATARHLIELVGLGGFEEARTSSAFHCCGPRSRPRR